MGVVSEITKLAGTSLSLCRLAAAAVVYCFDIFIPDIHMRLISPLNYHNLVAKRK